jgi:hypothetical protein
MRFGRTQPLDVANTVAETHLLKKYIKIFRGEEYILELQLDWKIARAEWFLGKGVTKYYI